MTIFLGYTVQRNVENRVWDSQLVDCHLVIKSSASVVIIIPIQLHLFIIKYLILYYHGFGYLRETCREQSWYGRNCSFQDLCKFNLDYV